MKLHLGCGETRLEGYLNVDQPPAAHTVQTRRTADAFADIGALRCPAGSVEEVRLHHVFEHFPRPVAFALAASWASWLREGGRLHVEVPDLHRTARAVVSRLSRKRARTVGIRHLFGSHEAPWAIHCEGWSAETLTDAFEAAGLALEEVRRTRWKDTYNVHVLARRGRTAPSREEVAARVRAVLAGYLVDETPGELRMLDVWMEGFAVQLERTWALPPGAPAPDGLTLVEPEQAAR